METVWMYGGGTQSIAMALWIADGTLPRPDRIVMADTGREASDTWAWLWGRVLPFLAAHGLTIELAPHDLATVDVYGLNGDVLIPAYTASGKLPTFCSNEWKTRVTRRYLRSRGVESCVAWLGMSYDELLRRRTSDRAWMEYAYPLIERRITRHDCRARILAAGWPEPPKSSCWMCPNRRNAQWQQMRQHQPADWQRAVAFDAAMRERHPGTYLHASRAPLAEADLSAPDLRQPSLFGEADGCDSGFCWT